MRDMGVFTVAVGSNPTINLPGSTAALAALRIYNFTPWTLQVNIGGATPVVAAQTRDLILIDPGWQWDGSLSFTASADVTLTQLSNMVRIVGFGAGESIPGTDPVSLVYAVGGALNVSGPIVTITGPTYNWLIQQDGSGNLEFLNTTTLASFFMDTTGELFVGHSIGTNIFLMGNWQVTQNIGGNLQFFNSSTSVTFVLDANGMIGLPSSHFVPVGVAPSIGSLASGVASASVTGSDLRGTITLTTTGAGVPIFTVLFIMTYNAAYTATPVVLVQGINTAIQFTPQVNMTQLAVVNLSALAASTTYNIEYIAMG